MNRFLSKDFLSGVMFIAFGMTALYFGQKLALGTPVRMGPGYVPHMLAFIMLELGGVIVLATLLTRPTVAEKEALLDPGGRPDGRRLRLSMIPGGANFISATCPGNAAP